MTKKKHPGGRPTKMTESVLSKLEEAFTYGYTDGEACLHAGVSTSTLERYCSEHPEFRVRKEILKKKPNMLAKRILHDQLSEGDAASAKWQLEKRDPDYNPKKVVEAEHILNGPSRIEIVPGGSSDHS